MWERPTHARILVCDNHAGRIIGNSGSTLAAMEAGSGAHITLSGRHRPPRRLHVRPLPRRHGRRRPRPQQDPLPGRPGDRRRRLLRRAHRQRRDHHQVYSVFLRPLDQVLAWCACNRCLDKALA